MEIILSSFILKRLPAANVRLIFQKSLSESVLFMNLYDLLGWNEVPLADSSGDVTAYRL